MKFRLAIRCLTTVLLAGFFTVGQAQENPVQFQTIKLSDQVYMLRGRGGNVGISAGTDGVFIIDDQVAPITSELQAAIAKVSQQPIRFVINTHYHGDHTGGNEAIGATGAVIVAHDKVHQRMSTDQFNNFWNETTPAYPKGALPVVSFSERVTLHLNGEAATVYHVPNAHTDGDGIVHFPRSNVIHMGDLYFNGLYPFVDLDGGGTVQGMIAGVKLGLSLANEDTKIIPGHGPLSTTAELKTYCDFLVRATANVQALVDQGASLEAAIEARPTADWDESLGKVWITPAQWVTFIYNSLTGKTTYTRIDANQ